MLVFKAEITNKVQDSGCQTHSPLLVQPVDKIVVVELVDQTHVGEIFGLCITRLEVFLANLGKNFSDSWIGAQMTLSSAI